MIKNIIFDIGNVLIHFAWEDYLHDLGYEGAMFDRVADAVFRSDDWDKGDSGLYTTQEWLDSFIENDPEIEEDRRYPQSVRRIWRVHCTISGNRTLAFVYS